MPGRIVHVYSSQGLYHAAFVERDSHFLREIALTGNMIKDHAMQAYFDALCEVQDVRRAPEQPPPWTAFHTCSKCQCCGAAFTWHITSSSEVQSHREKHNCRKCGLLVCDPCSRSRKPLPAIGLNIPVRICDRCRCSLLYTTDAADDRIRV